MSTIDGWLPEARIQAAQCWCDEETRHIEMDAALAEAFARRLAAWMDTAAFHARNEQYWRNQVQEHNRVCAESCHSRYVYDNCAYRRKDGSFIYGGKRCSDCPEHWIIKDNR